MKKFFIFSALLIIVCNIYYHLTYKGDIRTPYYEIKTRIGTAPLKVSAGRQARGRILGACPLRVFR